MPSGSDGYDCFRELIQELQREHFDEVAGRIDSILNHVAWTTSSELVGELGAAIRDFERAQPGFSFVAVGSRTMCADRGSGLARFPELSFRTKIGMS